MELISQPTSEHLLSPSLASLHAESREWRNEIEFWKDEMAFFYRLLHLREPHKSFPTEALADLEKELLQITSDKLGALKTALEDHERQLSQVFNSTLMVDEEKYRRRHRQLQSDLNGLGNVIWTFKKNIFSFI